MVVSKNMEILFLQKFCPTKISTIFYNLASLIATSLSFCVFMFFMFILCFSLEPECLGVLLSQLVVTLSSLIDDYPKIITEALNYLIIEHRYHLIIYVLYLLDL